jgi:hypothetical protein
MMTMIEKWWVKTTCLDKLTTAYPLHAVIHNVAQRHVAGCRQGSTLTVGSPYAAMLDRFLTWLTIAHLISLYVQSATIVSRAWLF